MLFFTTVDLVVSKRPRSMAQHQPGGQKEKGNAKRKDFEQHLNVARKGRANFQTDPRRKKK